jgi:hypothetical protein
MLSLMSRQFSQEEWSRVTRGPANDVSEDAAPPEDCLCRYLKAGKA